MNQIELENDDLGPRCKAHSESLSHLFRDWSKAQEIWSSIRGRLAHKRKREANSRMDFLLRILMLNTSPILGTFCSSQSYGKFGLIETPKFLKIEEMIPGKHQES